MGECLHLSHSLMRKHKRPMDAFVFALFNNQLVTKLKLKAQLRWTEREITALPL